MKFTMNKRHLILLALIVICLPLVLSGCGKKVAKTDEATKVEDDFNVDLSLPSQQAGNLKNVPKEEIDTLFSNIKE